MCMQSIKKSIEIKKSLFIAVVATLWLTVSAHVAFAQDCTTTLCNPLKAKNITEFLMNVVEVLLVFAIPVVVFFIIYAGYKFVIAQGNQAQITEARNALTWAVVGGVIILGANLIITVIENTVKAI